MLAIVCRLFDSQLVGTCSWTEIAHLLIEHPANVVLQRVVVAASCAIFYLLAIGLPMRSVVDTCLLATLALLACVEKLCSVLNLVSVERDWVGG